jgi:hypothetical protein
VHQKPHQIEGLDGVSLGWSRHVAELVGMESGNVATVLENAETIGIEEILQALLMHLRKRRSPDARLRLSHVG